MKKSISIVLLLCMLVGLFSGMSFAVDEPQQPEESTPVEETVSETEAEAVEAAEAVETAEAAEEAAPAEESEPADPSLRDSLDAVWNKRLYVAATPAAGLNGKVSVKLDLLKSVGTLYLPGKADVSALRLSWDDPAVTVQKDGVVYQSGAAPIPAKGESAVYQITKGKAVALVTIRTVQGSADVEPMFLELDEGLGTIDAMNSDDEHETKCYGKVLFDGHDNYVSIKGRGNSTWSFSKKPYNITLYKDDTYNNDLKQKEVYIPGAKKSNKYCLLANYLDNSLLRNKVAMDLADGLGIGLGNEKLATDVVNGIGLGSRFVDLWMNGEYLGNYLMTPKKDLNVKDKGFMIDNDHIPEDVDQFKIEGMHDMLLKHNRINIEEIGDDLVEAGYGQAEIEAYVNEAFAALTKYDTEEYQNYFDINSFAKMFLMVEVAKTYDCYAGNFLMRRDGIKPENKLIAGPAWDYDIAFGRTLHKFLVWQTEPMQLNAEGWFNDSVGALIVDEPVSILQELGKHASFMREVAKVYNENLKLFEDLPANVDRQREIIRASALMNNDLWGTHSLSADYLIAPNTMSLLGTGKYALHYDVTLTWDNYVNNVKEFCDKRVMWLTDHLETKAPEGTIVQKQLADGSVQLEVQLTSSGTKNTFQWQILQDGVWVNVEGATSAKLKLTPEQQVDATYRCVVNDVSTVITQFHGGSVTVPVETTIDPDPAAEPIRMENVELRDGTFTLTLGGEDVGDYTFQRSGDGWTIQNAAGKYLNASIWGVSWSRTALVWQLRDGVFTTTTTAARTSLFKLITLGYLIDVQLTAENGQIATTTGSGMTAGFLAPAGK